MEPLGQTGASEHLRLCDFIESQRAEILLDWERVVRSFPGMQDSDRSTLRDHIPPLLERIAEVVRTVHTGARASLEDVPVLHALHRLDTGVELEAVVAELSALRRTILSRWRPHVRGMDGAAVLMEIDRLNGTLDLAIAESVAKYASARDRTLRALDELSSAALGTGDLETFLPELLNVALHTTDAADSAALYLRQGERLVAKAAVGQGAVASSAFSVSIGQGFVGKIARERRPHLLRRASTDPIMLNPGVRDHGVLALYGVPLVHGDDLIGVAQLGSTTAYDFVEDDKQLFRTMAQRATSIIVQADLLRRQQEEQRRRLEFERQLVGIVSHDLRNPLGVIALSAATLLQRADELDDRTVRSAARIRSSAETATRLIGDLLDFTRARLGTGIPVTKRPADLHRLARQAADEIAVSYPGRRIDVEERGRGEVLLDPDRMLQAIWNLLTNAMKYGLPESPVTLRTEVRDEAFEVQVHNAGAIPEEFKPRLFQPLQTQDRGGKGVGLGLFIVSEIVREHGGTVDVESTPEAGTTFTLRLPAR